jgi:hypothetical protein
MVSTDSLTSPPVTPAPSTTIPSRSAKPAPIEPSGPHDASIPGEALHAGLPQGYPYAQYPRYYDYGDPRSRPLTDPYSSYFPSAAPPPPTILPRASGSELVQAPQPTGSLKPILPEEVLKASVETVPSAYPRVSTLPLAKSTVPVDLVEPVPAKPIDPTPATRTSTASSSGVPAVIREEAHVPTAFSHPSSVRAAYPGPYPPTPYDPYSQHYPPAPASSATYSPGGGFSLCSLCSYSFALFLNVLQYSDESFPGIFHDISCSSVRFKYMF